MDFNNGDQYVGGFLNDKKHGQGKYTNANGWKTWGEWENDLKKERRW